MKSGKDHTVAIQSRFLQFENQNVKYLTALKRITIYRKNFISDRESNLHLLVTIGLFWYLINNISTISICLQNIDSKVCKKANSSNSHKSFTLKNIINSHFKLQNSKSRNNLNNLNPRPLFGWFIMFDLACGWKVLGNYSPYNRIAAWICKRITLTQFEAQRFTSLYGKLTHCG